MPPVETDDVFVAPVFADAAEVELCGGFIVVGGENTLSCAFGVTFTQDIEVMSVGQLQLFLVTCTDQRLKFF